MTPDEVAARTAARMEHLKQILSPEEWAQVVAGSQSHCTCGGTWPCTGPAWMGDHSPVTDDDEQPVDAATAIGEALNEFNRLADEHWQSSDPLAAVADEFNRWAVARADELTVRRDCPECGGRHTQYEYDDAHRNDEGGY